MSGVSRAVPYAILGIGLVGAIGAGVIGYEIGYKTANPTPPPSSGNTPAQQMWNTVRNGWAGLPYDLANLAHGLFPSIPVPPQNDQPTGATPVWAGKGLPVVPGRMNIASAVKSSVM